MNEYYEGKLIGPYVSKWLDNHSNIERIDLNELDGNGEHQRAYFNGHLFTGIGYDIDDGVCHEESDFKNGLVGQTVTFFGDGDIDSIYLKNDTLVEYVIFDKQGFIKEYNLNKFGVFDVTFGYIEGWLRSVKIEGDFFNQVNNDEYLIGIEVPDSLDKIKNLNVASTLYLNGSGVDDEFFKSIMHNDKLKKTDDMTISNTSLTLKSLVNIIHDNRLISLWVRDERADILLDLPPLLQTLKIENPECDVMFNGKAIR